MTDQREWSMDELLDALAELNHKWETRSREARAHSEALRVGNSHQAHFYQGVSRGYQAAWEDLRALLEQIIRPETQTPAVYAIVSQARALEVMSGLGFMVADLHAHADNTFSLIFSPLQTTPIEERVARLQAAAPVEVLDYGRLPNSIRAYIDFGFTGTP